MIILLVYIGLTIGYGEFPSTERIITLSVCSIVVISGLLLSVLQTKKLKNVAVAIIKAVVNIIGGVVYTLLIIGH